MDKDLIRLELRETFDNVLCLVEDYKQHPDTDSMDLLRMHDGIKTAMTMLCRDLGFTIIDEVI
jgi:hypothetical protein